jgi:hypothetical protein
MRRRAALVFVLALCVPAAAAQAATISVLRPFSGEGFDAVGVAPFDPALGTLDSVDVHIFGTLTMSGLLPQHGFVDIGGFVPIPYAYSIDLLQRFLGIGGYFTFDDPATFRFTGAATGFATPLTLTTNYSYDFEFNAATDLAGGFALFNPTTTLGALVPPLNGASGRRTDFDNVAFPIHEIDLIQQIGPITTSGALPLIQSFQTTGLLELRYNYTPAPEPVPEPASLVLVGTGLAAAAAARRRRAR